jgi:hypothetical protein
MFSTPYAEQDDKTLGAAASRGSTLRDDRDLETRPKNDFVPNRSPAASRIVDTTTVNGCKPTSTLSASGKRENLGNSASLQKSWRNEHRFAQAIDEN